MPIGPNSLVRLHYWIRLENGYLADTTETDDPLEVRLGEEALPTGFEAALQGLKPGEQKAFQLAEDAAYGPHNPELIQPLPLAQFDTPPEVGQILEFAAPNGDSTPGLVTAIMEDEVTLDLNHPLAGHRLDIQVAIVAVSD